MRYWLYSVLILLLLACGNQHDEKKKIPYSKLKTSLMKKNKSFTQIESEQIDAYIKRRNLKNVKKSNTGLRYQIYQKGYGISPKCGNIAVIKYKLSLLNGETLYQTPPDKTTQFLVCKDDVESGLHEGIQYLKVGDKALIIIPSHLAHGIAGDFEKIPPRSTIIYDIQLIGVK